MTFPGDYMNHKRFTVALAAAALLLGAAHLGGAAHRPGAAQEEKPKVAHTNLKIGDVAPDFTLLDNHWKQVHLADFRGKKNVVLAFYVLAFTEG
jgi:cytochrome oxidase Cu insertion factor (SCO1/SenC/PrrC family)